MTRAARVAALAATLLASSLPVAAGAPAVPTSAVAPGDPVELVSQDPWTPAGGDLQIGLRVAESIAGAPDATVRFVAYQALGSRAEFDRVISDGPRRSILDELEIPLAALTPDANGTRLVLLGLESPQLRDPSRLGLRRAGVYPLTIELGTARSDEPSASSLMTFVVVTEANADGQARQLASPLGVAWVSPVQAGPSMLPDGSLDPAVIESFGVDGRLGRQAAALARAGDVRFTLVPGAETLQTWVTQSRDDPAAARGASAVLDAAMRAEVISTTYVPSDLPSLLRAELVEVFDRQRAHGSVVLDSLLDSPPVTTTALVRPVDDRSLTRLRAAGVERVIVDSAALAVGNDGSSTITAPFQIRPEGDNQGTLAALASDSGFVSLLAGTDSAALRAQRVLAGLSIVALEAPSVPRAVVLAAQSELAVPSELLDVLFAGLRGNPWLQSMTVSDVFASVPDAGGRSADVRALEPAPVPNPPVPADVYRFTQAHVDAFAPSVGADDPIVNEAEQALLIAESSTFVGPDGRARASATVDHANEEIDAFLARIRVPDPGTITLTSRAGEIPLTFRNDTGRKIRVTVTVESPKLFFPEGSTYTIDLAPRSTTLPVAVEARTSGSFSLRLSVRTAEGGLVIAETRFRVRSTVVSAVGLTLMIGAAVFLALWWGLYILRARRRRDEAAQRG